MEKLEHPDFPTQNLNGLPLPKPLFLPPLEPEFRPAVLANQQFERSVAAVGEPLVIGLEREDGQIGRLETKIFPAAHPNAGANFAYIERLVKFMLWQRGGFKLYIGGDRALAASIQKAYGPGGSRQWDRQFMAEQVYEQPFEVIACQINEVPAAREAGITLGRHLDGCRIGFDLGASDRKVSAVINGEVVYSEEVIWEPRKQSDPDYHYRQILTALKTAAAQMPRVDAVGGSSAGIIINNQPKVASLFRNVPAEKFGDVKSLFQRLGQELGVPFEVINDGDVTALAGSMSLDDDGVLGIAMGSSEATGYVDTQGKIKGWLNELAFAPVDYNPSGPRDEWSGDIGLGSQYFSQQCVFRLAPRAGIEIPVNLTDAEKLKFVQVQLEAGHPGACKIWESMGIYLGYGIAHYAQFYDIRHVLILGRCTSGSGGDLILKGAVNVLVSEFPELAARIQIRLPDEKSRRVGQSIAAASLPALAQK